MQHLEVAEDLGPADLEHPAEGGGLVDDAAEIADHVLDPDGLGLRRDPPWHDHRRQVLDQLAGQLPRRSAGTDDDSSAQHRHRHSGLAEKPLDLASRAQVRGELVVIAPEPPEVDDLAYAGFRGDPPEGAGGVGVASFEVHAVQRVHKIDRHVDAEQRLDQGIGVVDVAADGFGLTGVVVGYRVMARTWNPRSTNVGTRRRPTNPVAPVTSTVALVMVVSNLAHWSTSADSQLVMDAAVVACGSARTSSRMTVQGKAGICGSVEPGNPKTGCSSLVNTFAARSC